KFEKQAVMHAKKSNISVGDKMIYVISDLHGMPLDELKALLKKADFSDEDWLYILGDVIDRQNDGGVEVLQWLTGQPNAELILGNHEAMLLSCDFLFEQITDDSIANLTAERLQVFNTYLRNGGDVTVKTLQNLNRQSPEAVQDILDYLRDCPLYETVSTDAGDFLLVHSGLGNFRADKRLREYTADELLWTRPTFDERYFDDIVTVFGHTPTAYYGEEHSGKIVKTETWIDIDIGVSDGNAPVLLRLDDLKELNLP
ncbi:MAG: metallophosphoesterase, partial [Clostridia bacterium]|nr:metallophosphoesterase [Clostridia bacterium]